jgi:hypothetical protein
MLDEKLTLDILAELQRERLSLAAAEYRRRCELRQEKATATAVGAVYVLVSCAALAAAAQMIGTIAGGKLLW